MIIISNKDQHNNVLLSEILPIPSNQLIENRFETMTGLKAACQGPCSGTCNGFA